MSAGLVAHESGDTLLRLSPTLVQPNDSSSDLIADKLGNLASALGSRTGVEANSNTQAGITGVNMMDDHWGLSCWLPPLSGMGLQPGQRTVWSYIPSAKRSRYPPHCQHAVFSQCRRERLAAVYRCRRELHWLF